MMTSAEFAKRWSPKCTHQLCPPECVRRRFVCDVRELVADAITQYREDIRTVFVKRQAKGELRDES